MKFFTADLHLGHTNILQMQQRPFKNLDEMNKIIIDNINATVSNYTNDELYLLGDLSHHIKPEETIELISKIKCNKKYLCIGNHDKADAIKKLAPDLFKDIQYYYQDICDQGAVFHLMHYPLASWKNQRRSKTFMLHGHIHSKPEYNLENKKNHILKFDCGVECCNYYPISSKQILEFFGEEVYMNPKVNYHII